MPRTIDAGKTFAAVKPGRLDELAESGYAQRRDADLARILAVSREPAGGRGRDPLPPPVYRRRSVPLLAGAAAAIAFGAVTVPGVLPGSESGTVGGPSRGESERVDARSFLMASAEKVEKAPTGTSWYTRVRTLEQVYSLPAKPRKEVPFTAYAAHTQESWRGPNRARTVVNEDVEITFATKSDEAAWKKMGSPRLWAGPSTQNYHGKGYVAVGNNRMSVRDLGKLPTDADALEAWFRKVYARERPDQWWPAKPTFREYLWGEGTALLGQAITPATRGALYRLLAEQPRITARKATDPLGREGIALMAPPREAKGEDPGGRSLVIIDRATGQLLTTTDFGRLGDDGELDWKKGINWYAYEAMGWTDRIGVPAQG